MLHRHQVGPASHTRSIESWKNNRRSSSYRYVYEAPHAMKNDTTDSNELCFLQHYDVPSVHVAQVHHRNTDSDASACSDLYETISDAFNTKSQMSPGFAICPTVAGCYKGRCAKPTNVTGEKHGAYPAIDLYETCIIPTLPGSVNNFEVAGRTNTQDGRTCDPIDVKGGSTSPWKEIS